MISHGAPTKVDCLGAACTGIRRTCRVTAPSNKPDQAAAQGFFCKALGGSHKVTPRMSKVDKNRANPPAACQEMQAEGRRSRRGSLGPCKGLHHAVEPGRRTLNRRGPPALGAVRPAWRPRQGVEPRPMLRTGRVRRVSKHDGAAQVRSRVVEVLTPEPLHHCHNKYLVNLDSASNNLNGLLNAINKLNVGVRVTSASN